MTSNAQKLPAEVAALIEAVDAVPGVAEVEVTYIYLPDIDLETLRFPDMADLPAAALRRSNGGLPEELLISITFRIERNETGLKGLEFLSWWVRDQARSGNNMQLRGLALPPNGGPAGIQLGRTLKFTIDWFLLNPSNHLKPILAALKEKSESVAFSLRIYRETF